MPLPPIPPIGGLDPSQFAEIAKPAPPAPGFGDMVQRGLEQVSGLEQRADAMTQSMATGGDVQIHELMVANTEAQLGIELLSQVRDKAVMAYQEIMRIQL